MPPRLGAAHAPAPVDVALYGPIRDEQAQADWRGAGLDPLRYVEDRLARSLFLDVLASDPAATVVIHAGARTFGDVAGVDPQALVRADLGDDARDFPARVARAPDGTFHIVGIVGEDWTLQLLHMLAVAGVEASRIAVARVREPAAVVAADLDDTLARHRFDSVVVGTVGELTRAVERVLRARDLPRHIDAVIAEMAARLDAQVQGARPDRRARWEDRRQRLEDHRARHPDPRQCLAAVEQDPVVGPALADLVRKAKEGAPPAALPLRSENGRAKVIGHRVLEVDGRKHLLLHVGGAHGDLAGLAVAHALAAQPQLGVVGFYGTCGSLDSRLRPDAFLRPVGAIASLESGRGAVVVDNRVQLAGAVDVAHTNVSTLLREHRQGLRSLQALGRSVDVESFHVARAVREAGRPVELRALLRVSDVATDPGLGAHRADRAGTSDYDARRDTEEAVVIALGLVDGPSGPSGSSGPSRRAP